MKKAVLKNFAMLTVHFRPATLSKKDYHWHFPLNIVSRFDLYFLSKKKIIQLK